MATTGSQLKTALGLDKYKHVYIRRMSGRSPIIYHVYIDTYMKNAPIFNSEIRNSDTVKVLNGKDFKIKKYRFLIPQKIEDFNGTIGSRDIIFFTDIAGDYLTRL